MCATRGSNFLHIGIVCTVLQWVRAASKPGPQRVNVPEYCSSLTRIIGLGIERETEHHLKRNLSTLRRQWDVRVLGNVDRWIQGTLLV